MQFAGHSLQATGLVELSGLEIRKACLVRLGVMMYGSSNQSRKIKTFGKKKKESTLVRDNWDAIINAPKTFTSWITNVLTPASKKPSPRTVEDDYIEEEKENQGVRIGQADNPDGSSTDRSEEDLVFRRRRLNDASYVMSGRKSHLPSVKRFHSVVASPSVTRTPKVNSMLDEDLDGSFISPERISNEVEDAVKDFSHLSLRDKSLSNSKNALEYLKELCNQKDIQSMKALIDGHVSGVIKKIGEGSYGEVFAMEFDGEPSAVKIIPVNGSIFVNGEPQMSLSQILPEVTISRRLNDLRNGDKDRSDGFIKVNQMKLCQGSYAEPLLSEWDSWDEQHESENDRPDLFSEDQLFMVFIFANGGKDLERFDISSAKQSLSLLLQVISSLCVAQNAYEFEHRDLHWGNILLSECSSSKEMSFAVDGEEYVFCSQGVEISIIDFSLSRMTDQDSVIFFDLEKDKAIFDGEGDYQFDIYRSMRGICNEHWEMHHPKTTVLWIDYIADKLVHEKKCKNGGKTNLKIYSELKKFRKRLKSYENISEVLDDPLWKDYISSSR